MREFILDRVMDLDRVVNYTYIQHIYFIDEGLSPYIAAVARYAKAPNAVSLSKLESTWYMVIKIGRCMEEKAKGKLHVCLSDGR